MAIFEVGKEAELVGHRLKDIVFFCECTAPVSDSAHGWAEYTHDLLRMIARSAREAQTALNVIAK